MMDQRNLILAAVASLLILLGFQYLYEMPRMRQQQWQEEQLRQQQAQQPAPTQTAPQTANAPEDQFPAPQSETAQPSGPAQLEDRAAVLARTPRVPIASPRVSGSIALAGGRVDDLVLKDYRTDVEPPAENIVLLSPPGAKDAYYAEFGWVAADASMPLPGGNTVWQADGAELTPGKPLTLTWDNGQGLRFIRSFALDGDYMFTVTQRVENNGPAPVTLFPYGLISRSGTPSVSGFFILHEGLIGVLEGTLKEIDYSDLQEDGPQQFQSAGGWLGITDKYWLVALVPPQDQQLEARFAHTLRSATDLYQTDYRLGGVTVAPGAAVESGSHLFAGAKEVRLLDRYREALAIPLFDRAVDFGWFWFLTKPIFYALDTIYRAVGNFGVAILLLTVAIKALLFPLANKSYRAMSRMKTLTPEMMKLRERFKEDRARLSQETMALYKREKVNPASGCLPILLQVPVFFALYKVLFVTIEMRHAPFFGWIQDLSAPDPTSIFNLFGALPFAVPDLGPLAILSIGIWPIIMGITMYLQQKLNPAPPDPVQARIFMLLPIIFTFMLAPFPAGLVIYWAWNNLLSIAQQRFIMWRMDVKT